ncbi:MAG: N-acetylmuramoyl-L-alanine amidase [Verrucomicrobia bacterium]|nr:N-acetylmuramoyl-L-alanine amidase [Verrucomicrobiota bacterium]
MGKLRAIWRKAAESVQRFLLTQTRTGIACVGLIVLAGCLTLVICPDTQDEEAPILSAARLPIVVIDAGHGGKDEGAKCKGVLEKTLTLDVALRLERILNARGFSTVQTRTEDVFIPLSERAQIANRVQGDAVFVSIHFNQGSGREIAGIETFYADNKVPIASDWTWLGLFSNAEPLDMGENLAAEVQYAVILKTGARDRGIRARHLYVTRHTRLPAVLVEGGFITNRMESHLLNEEHYAETLAAGIADGIEAWCRSRQKTVPPTLAQAP